MVTLCCQFSKHTLSEKTLYNCLFLQKGCSLHVHQTTDCGFRTCQNDGYSAFMRLVYKFPQHAFVREKKDSSSFSYNKIGK